MEKITMYVKATETLMEGTPKNAEQAKRQLDALGTLDDLLPDTYPHHWDRVCAGIRESKRRRRIAKMYWAFRAVEAANC